ncbi:hypothetical protein VTL71DRAFT_12574 [Oculimacula yallundae]|uniref:Uncharacterized protein n=1 Tax=Oculimacula yallundae TaxID=86028 RepID=A0ABR4CNG2_9HELO
MGLYRERYKVLYNLA